jgi:hypothetical protein
MMNINRYKGVVKNLGKNCAFIGLESVTMFDGLPHDLSTERDIFVHLDEFVGQEFRIGMELSFEVNEDPRPKKKGALRAKEVVLSGVEIQFPERVVDHPVVPVTWCFKPSVLEYIKAHPEKTFALVIGTVLFDSDSRARSLEYNIGLSALKDGRSYINFYRPGEYGVYAYLVEYGEDEATVKKAMSDLDSYHYDAKDGDGRLVVRRSADLRFLHARDVEGKVLAVSELSISVPDGIFAKPMTGYTLKWFKYFWVEDLLDDCDRRAKQWFAFTLGIPVFIVWELLKRLAFFIFGFAMLVIGVKPMFAWKETVSRRLSADYYAVKHGEVDELMDYDGWKGIFRPWVVIVFSMAVWAFFNIDEFREVVIIVAIAVPIFIALLLGYYALRRFFHKDEEEKRAEEIMRNEQVLEQLETLVQCGAAPAKKPASVRLIFLGIKRAVCRNYRKG